MASTEDLKAETANLGSTVPETKDPMEGEMTAPMETSPEAGWSSLKKRKANIQDQSDAGDDEESDGEAEEDKESSDEEWGVDSLDGWEFESDDGGYSDDELKQKWRRFKRQLQQSKGFHVDPENIPDDLMFGILPFTDLDEPYLSRDTVRELLEEFVELTLDKYNKEKGAEVKLDTIVSANRRVCCGVKFYITFMAKESEDAEPKEYQAKVWRKIGPRICPIFCRPKP